MLAAISAPNPDVNGASWAISNLPVFFTDCIVVPEYIDHREILESEMINDDNNGIIDLENNKNKKQTTSREKRKWDEQQTKKENQKQKKRMHKSDRKYLCADDINIIIYRERHNKSVRKEFSLPRRAWPAL